MGSVSDPPEGSVSARATAVELREVWVQSDGVRFPSHSDANKGVGNRDNETKIPPQRPKRASQV